MNRIASSSLTLLMMLLAFAFAENRSFGQSPPTVVPRPANPPTPVSDRDSDLRSESEAKIRDVLQGKTPARTGDGVLEDVLGVIQRQGSVLDGSTLDQPPLRDNPLPGIAGHGSVPDAQTLADQRARVAEQLLRAARMLQQISKDDSSAALVASMRRQAAGLLVTPENSTP